MDFQVKWVNVADFGGSQPIVMLERKLLHGTNRFGGVFTTGAAEVARTGEYWVPQGSLLAADPHWTMTKFGEFVRVPMTAYRTVDRALPTLWALGLQLGLLAHRSFIEHRPEVDLASITLVLSNAYDDLFPEPALRCCAGLAFLLKE